MSAKLIKKQHYSSFELSFYYLCMTKWPPINDLTKQGYETEEIYLAGT